MAEIDLCFICGFWAIRVSSTDLSGYSNVVVHGVSRKRYGLEDMDIKHQAKRLCGDHWSICPSRPLLCPRAYHSFPSQPNRVPDSPDGRWKIGYEFAINSIIRSYRPVLLPYTPVIKEKNRRILPPSHSPLATPYPLDTSQLPLERGRPLAIIRFSLHR